MVTSWFHRGASATVPSEIFGGAYAYITGTGFTDTVFPYPATTTNVNWTTRDQCFWPLARTNDPEGDATDPVDYGAISYNAESGRFRARIDFYQEVAIGSQEVQAYLWDETVASGNAAIILSVVNSEVRVTSEPCAAAVTAVS